ncbi:MAG TPA: hypothetical protein V6D11_32965 [Waterburya sp.]|jgi:hypothetical protein
MKKNPQLVPAFASTLVARIALGVGVSTVAIALTAAVFPQVASAQLTPGSAQPLPDQSRQNERDSFGGNLGNGDLSIFNLIHRAQLGGLRDMGEFSQEQNQNLNSAAEEYKRRQLQLIRQPQQQVPQNSGINPQPENQQGNQSINK